jgi:hypothetical protein
LAVPLVVVYQRAGVRAVVAVLSALLLAFCYRVACYLLAVALLVACWQALAVALVAVALLVALAWPYWWPAGAVAVAVAVHAWPLVVACCWPAAGALAVVVAGGLAGGRMRPVESTIYC